MAAVMSRPGLLLGEFLDSRESTPSFVNRESASAKWSLDVFIRAAACAVRRAKEALVEVRGLTLLTEIAGISSFSSLGCDALESDLVKLLVIN